MAASTTAAAAAAAAYARGRCCCTLELHQPAFCFKDGMVDGRFTLMAKCPDPGCSSVVHATVNVTAAGIQGCC